MLKAIVHFSLKYRGVVLALALVLLVYGFYDLHQAQYDVFPEFAPPQAVIQTEAPGLSPEQVETLVTQPIENAVNGVSDIQALRSQSIQGLSVIQVVFGLHSDIYRDRQIVAERLTTIAGNMPQGVNAPILTPLTSSMSIMYGIGLTSDKLTPMQLRTQADWVVKQRLLAVPGVAKVSVFGGDVRQLQIQILPDKLRYYNLAFEDVVAVARKATGIQGAGFIDTTNQRITLQTYGQMSTSDQLSKTPIVRGTDEAVSLNITLGDVAEIAEAPAPPIGAATVMGKNGIIMLVSSQYGANTLQLDHKIEAAMAELNPALKAQDISVNEEIFRPANFIQIALVNVRDALLIGSVLVIVVLFLFLNNARTALISAAAIPLSLLTAAAVLRYFDLSLNTMTLGGLAIAIGEVVDDAVIDVENILRRLRENQALGNPKSRLRTMLNASIEVRSAVVFATFAVVLVFVPVMTIGGLGGSLFAPLGFAYIAAILASLLVALTVTPALCMLFLRVNGTHGETRFVRWLKMSYRRWLEAIEHTPRALLVFAAVLTVASLASLPFMTGELIPELQEGHYIVRMMAVPGTSLHETIRIGDRVTETLLKLPFVRSVTQQAGRAELGDDTTGTHYSEFQVDLKPLTGDAAEQAPLEIKKVLAVFPGINFAVNTFLAERVDETISGYTAGVVLNIYGSDLNALDKAADEIVPLIQSLHGAANVQMQSPPGTPQLSIHLREKDLKYWGFDPVDVLSAVRTAYQGDTVAQIYEGNQIYNVTAILAPSARQDVTHVGDLPLRSPSGSYVKLSQLADIQETSGRYVILHDGARRVQTIIFDVTGRDQSDFIKEAQKLIAEKVKLPAGSYVAFSGTAEEQAQARSNLILHSLIALCAIIALLSIVMGNRNNLLLVLINLPFALVGGVLAVWMTGGVLALGAMVGFVTLFGITLRNSVMMISHYEHLVVVEGQKWNLETALRGASERLLPILMTATVTALGLLPLAIGSGDPGREVEGPMAMVILGGLITSTTLNLLVLPTLALRYGRFGEREKDNE